MAICAKVNSSNYVIVQPNVAVTENCNYILLNGYEFSNTMAGFDYALASQFWAFGITVVVVCYLVAHYAGAIIRFIQQIFGVRR